VKAIVYGGTTFLTEDGIADAVVELAAAHAFTGTAVVAEFPAMHAGTETVARLVLSAGTPLASFEVEDGYAVLTGADEAVARLAALLPR
jgi:hypothetical protein